MTFDTDVQCFSVIFFIQEDFLAVEMVNRKMRFVWNLGDGPGEVTHPLHIQTAGDLSNDQHWYRVEAER